MHENLLLGTIGIVLVATAANACSKDNTVESPDVVCAAGEYSCQVTALRICNDSRTGWIDVDVCGDGTRCDAVAKSCVLDGTGGAGGTAGAGGTGGSSAGSGGGASGGAGGSADGGQAGTGGAAGSCPTGMVEVPPGSYTPGNPSYTGGPASVARFCLDKAEVTVADYADCGPTCSAPDGTATNQFCNWDSGRTGHPVNCVDWVQATAYCAAQTPKKRLPTEEEWEWAARHGDDAWTYPWGLGAPTAGSACWNKSDGTCVEGSHGEFGYGLQDMAGNVGEWTASKYNATDYVVRGGSWLSYADDLRVSFRLDSTPSARGYYLGFRCALSP